MKMRLLMLMRRRLRRRRAQRVRLAQRAKRRAPQPFGAARIVKDVAAREGDALVAGRHLAQTNRAARLVASTTTRGAAAAGGVKCAQRRKLPPRSGRRPHTADRPQSESAPWCTWPQRARHPLRGRALRTPFGLVRKHERTAWSMAVGAGCGIGTRTSEPLTPLRKMPCICARRSRGN